MYNFISLQSDYWDSPWQNRHAFLSELSKDNKIFFLSPPFYIVDIIKINLYNKTKLRGLKKINDNLFCYVPPRYLPYNLRYKKIDKIITKIRTFLINKKLNSLKLSCPILLVWHPCFVNQVHMFQSSFVIYYKYDHYAGYFDGTGEISQDEKKMFQIADQVCVTSRGLFERHKDDTENICLLPNGVDISRFSRGRCEIINTPDDIKTIPSPRIGYIGTINEKVDFKLLAYIARKKPEWSIILVGPERVNEPEYRPNFLELGKFQNVYLLGYKENQLIPEYINSLDVCMMCYLINEWTYYGYPLKMHEYLACGKPTISTNLPEVIPYSDVVKIPKSYSEWVTEIELLLRQESQAIINQRISVAHENSWSNRVDKMLSLIP